MLFIRMILIPVDSFFTVKPGSASKQAPYVNAAIVKGCSPADIRHTSRRQSVDRRARFLVPGSEKQVQHTRAYRIRLFDDATYIASFIPYFNPVSVLQSGFCRLLFIYGKDRSDFQT